jgi:hypothetical protein
MDCPSKGCILYICGNRNDVFRDLQYLGRSRRPRRGGGGTWGATGWGAAWTLVSFTSCLGAGLAAACSGAAATGAGATGAVWEKGHGYTLVAFEWDILIHS